MSESTSAKRKRRAPTKKTLESYRKSLLEHRQEILNLYEHDVRVGQAASDEGSEDLVDRANSAYNREFMFALSDTERTILREIDEAIARIDDKAYGVCPNCDDSIPVARLRALPWAKYCIDCQERVEQGAILDS